MTLFDKYGGVTTFSKVITNFYERVYARPNLRHYFDIMDKPRLIQHQVEFVAYLLGKPMRDYSEYHLRSFHERLNITGKAFDDLVKIFQEELEAVKVSSADIASIIDVVHGLRKDIVTRN
jgi:hemoglobin